MPKNLVTQLKNAATEYPLKLKSYSKQKKIAQEKHSPTWNQIQSQIDNRLRDFISFQEAASQHITPELLQTLTQNPTYIASQDRYFEKIAQLQIQLADVKKFADTQSVTSKMEMQTFKELLKHKTDELEKNSAEIFAQLSQDMSDLLHCCADTLLEDRKNSESSLAIKRIKVAVILESMGLGTQSSEQPAAELTTTLTTIIASQNLSKACRDQLENILGIIKDSPHNTPFVLSALSETLESVAEPDQTRIKEIITNVPLSPAARLATLAYELSDEFYLANFNAVFNAFIATDKSNRQLLTEIQARLTALEALAPNCEALQTLISNCRLSINNSHSKAISEPTLNNYNELSTQLASLKNDLEMGNLFNAVKIKIKNELITLKTCLEYLIEINHSAIKLVFEKWKTGSQLEGQEIQYLFPLLEKTLNNLARRIDHYSKLTNLSQIIESGEINEEEINNIYSTIQREAAEYRFALNILNGKECDVEKFILTNLGNVRTYREQIEKLAVKIFFFLKEENIHNQNQDHRLKNLRHFFNATEEHQLPDSYLLFKNEFRQVMTEKSLASIKSLYKSSDSLATICKLFNGFKNFHRLALLATPEAKDWFDNINNSLNAFMQCTADIDIKKSRYTSTFFLTGDQSKQQFITELKETLQRLPLNTPQQELEKIFTEWENKYKSIIDNPRYHPVITQLMEIFHQLQTLLTGKVFATESRHLVNRLKESAFEVLNNTQINSPTTRSI